MSLPKDVILEIFSYLDFKTQVTIIPLISKLWESETTPLLNRCAPDWASPNELYFYSRKLRPANAQSYVRVIERSLFSHIHNVTFSRSYETDPTVIRALINHCPYITHFEFNTIGPINPFALLTSWPQSDEAPALTSMKFFRSQMVTREMIESITMCFPNLKSVWFYKTYCHWDDIDFLEQYIDHIEYDSTGDDWKPDCYKWKRDEFWKWSQEPNDDDDD